MSSPSKCLRTTGAARCLLQHSTVAMRWTKHQRQSGRGQTTAVSFRHSPEKVTSPPSLSPRDQLNPRRSWKRPGRLSDSCAYSERLWLLHSGSECAISVMILKTSTLVRHIGLSKVKRPRGFSEAHSGHKPHLWSHTSLVRGFDIKSYRFFF